MEKKRRERINRSLEELKNLILDQTNHTVSNSLGGLYSSYRVLIDIYFSLSRLLQTNI